MTSAREVTLRQFQFQDAPAVSALIATTMRQSNARDYKPERLDALIAYFTADKLRALAAERDCFVALVDGTIVGTAARDHDELVTFFVSPANQSQGIGARLLELLEGRARGTGIRRLRVHASLTGVGFYIRYGYRSAGPPVEGTAGLQVPLVKDLDAAG